MARAFADVLRDLAGGTTYELLGTALTDLVQEVINTGKGGDLTLKLKVKPNGDNSVTINDDVKVRVPQGNRGDTIFFATMGGSLSRDDPRQQKLPLRRVGEPEATPTAAQGGE